MWLLSCLLIKILIACELHCWGDVLLDDVVMANHQSDRFEFGSPEMNSALGLKIRLISLDS